MDWRDIKLSRHLYLRRWWNRFDKPVSRGIFQCPRPTAKAYKPLIRSSPLLKLARIFFCAIPERRNSQSTAMADKSRPNVDDLLNRLEAREDAFLRQEFLAPALHGGSVRVRIGGAVCHVKIEPPGIVFDILRQSGCLFDIALLPCSPGRILAVICGV